MSVSSRYKDAWESFWRDAPGEAGGVFWDAGPELTAARHLSLFEPHFRAGLPLVDLGCGNGTQTRFLAGRYPGTVGADLSAAAVGRARNADPRGLAEYGELDATDKAAALELHKRLGDANVYMRGVLHQCEPEDRGPLLEGVAALLGERGRAFLVELSETAGRVLLGLARGEGGPPPKLRPVLSHGIAPGAVRDGAVEPLVREAGLQVLAGGELELATTECRADGSRIVLPSLWLVVGRKS